MAQGKGTNNPDPGKPDSGGPDFHGQDWAVLVVEDDPLVRATAVDLFGGLGLRTYDAYNGPAALDLIEATPDIRLVFADVRMPGMDGTTLAKQIAELRPDVKVVLTSGYVDAAEVSGFCFIAKPLRMADVAMVVAAACPPGKTGRS